MRRTLILVCLVFLPSLALAQVPVKNPTKLIFTPSPDHDLLTSYEFDIKGLTGVVEKS